MSQQAQQGWNQGTPAMRAIMSVGLAAGRSLRSSKRRTRSSTATPKRRKKRASSSGKRTRKSASSRKGKLSRLVKGSAAAKAYMAKIRRKRK